MAPVMVLAIGVPGFTFLHGTRFLDVQAIQHMMPPHIVPVHRCEEVALASARLRSRKMHSARPGPAILPTFTAVSQSKYPAHEIQGWIDADAGHYHLIGKFFRRHANKACRIVDVGSNHGFYSIFAAKLGCSADAYEPQQELRLRACVAYHQNSVLSRVTEHAAGIGSSRGVYRVIGSEGGAHLAACDNEHAEGCIPTYRLDDIYASNRSSSWPSAPQQVTFLKIDVEGWELGVLQGASKFLQLKRGDRPQAMLIEIAPSRWPLRSGFSISAGAALLRSLMVRRKYGMLLVSEAFLGGHCPHQILGAPLLSGQANGPASQSCWSPPCTHEHSIFTTVTPSEVTSLLQRMLTYENQSQIEASCNLWLEVRYGTKDLWKVPSTLGSPAVGVGRRHSSVDLGQSLQSAMVTAFNHYSSDHTSVPAVAASA